MATYGPRERGSERRDTVLRARRDYLRQHDVTLAALFRRFRPPVTGSGSTTGPTEDSIANVVLLRKDLLNVVGSPTLGATEIEVVIDSDGGIRFYALP